MMSFTITDNSDAVMRALREQCMEGLQEIGEEAVKQARKTVQSKHLVDTGDLRDSIRYSLGHDGVYVGTDNDHAAFHELGIRRKAAALHPKCRSRPPEKVYRHYEKSHGR